jgi:hypothetical protein
MNRWEETWRAVLSPLDGVYDIGPLAGERMIPDGTIELATRNLDMAMLAAAAPDMARVLIALEATSRGCPSCGSFGPRPNYEPGTGVHSHGCTLVVALKKAGVIT